MFFWPHSISSYWWVALKAASYHQPVNILDYHLPKPRHFGFHFCLANYHAFVSVFDSVFNFPQQIGDFAISCSINYLLHLNNWQCMSEILANCDTWRNGQGTRDSRQLFIQRSIQNEVVKKIFLAKIVFFASYFS